MTVKNRYGSASTSSEYFSEEEHSQVGDTKAAEDEQGLDKGETEVWENLKKIFKDLDAHKDKSENKLLLEKQILHLRRLLEIHETMLAVLVVEEEALEKAHFGVLYEREWYLRKLEALEIAIGPFLLPKQPGGGGKNKQATIALSGAIRAILYEPSKDTPA